MENEVGKWGKCDLWCAGLTNPDGSAKQGTADHSAAAGAARGQRVPCPGAPESVLT